MTLKVAVKEKNTNLFQIVHNHGKKKGNGKIHLGKEKQ